MGFEPLKVHAGLNITQHIPTHTPVGSDEFYTVLASMRPYKSTISHTDIESHSYFVQIDR